MCAGAGVYVSYVHAGVCVCVTVCVWLCVCVCVFYFVSWDRNQRELISAQMISLEYSQQRHRLPVVILMACKGTGYINSTKGSFFCTFKKCF